MEKMFMRVSEVMEALDVSESYAYKLICPFTGTISISLPNPF